MLCEFCLIDFIPSNLKQKYCSLSCANKARTKPRFCKSGCGTQLKKTQRRDSYCSVSCASINRPKKTKISFTCETCSTEIKTKAKYCKSCSVIHSRTKKIENNEIDNRRTLRRHLIDLRGHECEKCKLTSWNDKPIPLTLEHKDGNATNNDITNLELLCWNCHAQTPTFGAKNIGNGRKSRGYDKNW